MNGIVCLLDNWRPQIKTIMNAILIIAGLAFGGVTLVKAVKEFGNKKTKEGVMWLLFTGAIALVVALGIMGVGALMDNMVGNAFNVTQGNNNWFANGK